MIKESYWTGKGLYQTELEVIWRDHVPYAGYCKLEAAENVRCMRNLYYDYYNNGWMNWDVYGREREVVSKCVDRLFGENHRFIPWDDEDFAIESVTLSPLNEIRLENVFDSIIFESWSDLYDENGNPDEGNRLSFDEAWREAVVISGIRMSQKANPEREGG